MNEGAKQWLVMVAIGAVIELTLLITAWLRFLSAQLTDKKIVETKAIAAHTQEIVNSRLDQLIETARAASYGLGLKDGLAAALLDPSMVQLVASQSIGERDRLARLIRAAAQRVIDEAGTQPCVASMFPPPVSTGEKIDKLIKIYKQQATEYQAEDA